MGQLPHQNFKLIRKNKLNVDQTFISLVGILKGCMPDGIILQHPPDRKFCCDFPHLLMPTIEIKVISQSQFIAIALNLNPENLTFPLLKKQFF